MTHQDLTDIVQNMTSMVVNKSVYCLEHEQIRICLEQNTLQNFKFPNTMLQKAEHYGNANLN
jgi:regulator of replication initiation timing